MRTRAIGATRTSRRMNRRTVSSRSSSEEPTTSTRSPAGVETVRAATRTGSASPGTSSTSANDLERASRRAVASSSTGVVPTCSVSPTTAPCSSSTCTKRACRSSVAIVPTPPVAPATRGASSPALPCSPSFTASSSDVPRRYRRKEPRPASTIAIARANASVRRRRIGIRFTAKLRPPRAAAGSRPHARSRANCDRTAGRSSPAGSGRRRRRRSSGSRRRSPRRARAGTRARARPPAAHERLEERELLPRERDLRFSPPDLPGRRVEPEVADLEPHRSLGRSAAHERAQPREQLGEREGLREVVVGACVEPRHPVVDRVPGREHEHRRPDAVLAPATTDARRRRPPAA